MQMGLQIFDTLHLGEIVAHGFSMVRIDLQHEPTPEPILDEIEAAGLIPLATLREVDQLDATGEGRLVELGNEPDLKKEGWGATIAKAAANYSVRAREFVERSRGRHRLCFGAVSNLHPRGFEFLEAMPWKEWPNDIVCVVHRYPGTNQGPEWCEARHPKKILGFTIPGAGRHYTRDEEIVRLKRIVGADRPIGLSELGYNKLEWPNIAEQAANLYWERKFFEKPEIGFDFGVLYQIHSGTGDEATIAESYGVRDHVTGEWREPLVTAWTGAAA